MGTRDETIVVLAEAETVAALIERTTGIKLHSGKASSGEGGPAVHSSLPAARVSCKLNCGVYEFAVLKGMKRIEKMLREGVQIIPLEISAAEASYLQELVGASSTPVRHILYSPKTPPLHNR